MFLDSLKVLTFLVSILLMLDNGLGDLILLINCFLFSYVSILLMLDNGLGVII